MYKIFLDDGSFIIADDDYALTLFRFGYKVMVRMKDYLIKSEYRKYYLLDNINGKKVKRKITKVEDIKESEFPVGARIKLAKDIKYNDLVLGKDGQPRRVKELHTGEDEMFEITVDGTSYTVNGGHILALVNKETGEHLEMPVNIYIHMDDDFKSYYVMEKVINE